MGDSTFGMRARAAATLNDEIYEAILEVDLDVEEAESALAEICLKAEAYGPSSLTQDLGEDTWPYQVALTAPSIYSCALAQLLNDQMLGSFAIVSAQFLQYRRCLDDFDIGRLESCAPYGLLTDD